MAAAPTYYDILGITPMAPPEVVSAVYRAWMQALRVHPDLGGDEELAKKINAAYETLKDPARRAEYDAG
ncbi:MAG TPA: J domain-containing protein, partial [bacterium]|nr:J domain-containing protein [bacterium]